MLPFWTGFFALLLSLVTLPAAPLRVVSWNLQPSSLAGTNGYAHRFQLDLIEAAADSLKKLNPDVILLQQVKDWDACSLLVRALKPVDYNVALCSSFRNANGKIATGHQVAILTKTRPYFSWSEAWTDDKIKAASGGFAFVAIRSGDKNIGLFCAQIGDEFAFAGSEQELPAQQQMRESAMRQLISQIDTARQWQANRLQSIIVAGDLNTTLDDPRFAGETTLLQLQQAGFSDVTASLPSTKKVTLPMNANHPAAIVDYIFTLNAPSNPPRIIRGALMEHALIATEISLPSPVAPVATALPAPVVAVNKATPLGETKLMASSPVTAEIKPVPASRQNLRYGWVLGVFIAGVIGIVAWFANRKHSRSTALIVASPVSAATALSALPESARASITANLGQWLKQTFIRKLIADRAQLMATQQVAALKILAVDERLAKIEQQIEERNREYEQRIEQLVAELEIARDENRELIQAKIDLVKAEMARQQNLKATRYPKPHQHN